MCEVDDDFPRLNVASVSSGGRAWALRDQVCQYRQNRAKYVRLELEYWFIVLDFVGYKKEY